MDGFIPADTAIDWTGEHSVPFFDVVANGLTIAKDVSQEKALRIRKDIWELCGARCDINEAYRIGEHGILDTVSAQEAFSHVPSHVSSDVPMYDVQIDGRVLAYNLTENAANDFIRASVDTLDILGAMVEALFAPAVGFGDLPARLPKILAPGSGVLCQRIDYP